MEIAIALRGGNNATDMRSLALAEGISWLPHTVRLISRAEDAKGADLLIQTGFGRSVALLSAIHQEIPYIIMEAPSFRGFYNVHKVSTFTYNGLQAGGIRPDSRGLEPRPAPELQRGVREGRTLILAQKPTDHSLRGSDHITWLLEKMDEYPEAELRHNPIMVPQGYNKPIGDALLDCRRTISYTSTAAVDSLLAGCETICEHPASEGYGVTDREEWRHRLSWANFTNIELSTDDVAAYIMSGYDEAEAHAEAGLQEIPRERVDGPAICKRYYRELT